MLSTLLLAPPLTPVTHPDWQLKVTNAATTAYGSWTSEDTAADAPILAFSGQDAIADITAGAVTLPLLDTANDLLAVDRLLHLYERGTLATSFVVKAANLLVVAAQEEAGETRTWQLESLYSMLAEAAVEPPGGVTPRPGAPDRIFDSSDPAHDGTGFTTAREYGSLNDATLNYPVIPYGYGITNRDTVKVIGPNGYSWGDDAPFGRCYFEDEGHDYGAGAYFIMRGTWDNGGELRDNGATIQSWNVGFGQAFEVPKMFLAGVHKLWSVVENNTGPCTFALEVLEVDAADNVIGLEHYTSNAWKVAEFPAEPPGFTVPQIARVVLEEKQALGFLTNIIPSFTDSHFSDGTPATNTYAISTKTSTVVSSFFLKELAETYADFRMRYVEGVGVVLDMYPKDGRGQVADVALARGVNIGQLSIEQQAAQATDALIEWNDAQQRAYNRGSVGPEAGHRRKELPLSLGAQRSAEEMARVAGVQLAKFGRLRKKIQITHVTTTETPDSEMPGVSYWVGDTITVPTDIDLTPGLIRVIAMTFELDAQTGMMRYTPELGDPIMPASLRSLQTLRSMARGTIGGQARVVGPNDA